MSGEDDKPTGSGWVAITTYPGNLFQDLVLRPWARMDGDEPVIGFRVLPYHCNPRQTCHGGMLMTFCDFFLPAIARLIDEHHDQFTPTISITTNFLAPAKLGSWLEARARTLRRSSNLLFVEGSVSDGDRLIVQASGIFKRGNSDGRTAGSAALLEQMRSAAV